jgi:SAM-dependent methyltransferase
MYGSNPSPDIDTYVVNSYDDTDIVIGVCIPVFPSLRREEPRMKTTVAVLCTVALLVAAFFYGRREWTGFGFDASGPEMLRLKEALALDAGSDVADVGAGKGQLTRALAELIGPSGHVFSTDVDPDRVRALRAMIAEANLGNVTVVEATSRDSGLQTGCCDAIVLRRVYHHLTDPAETNASLLRALRPGGLLAVIDFPPPSFIGRGSLGVPAQNMVDEVTASGFEILQLRRDWPGRGPLESYCALFRKPPQKQGSR